MHVRNLRWGLEGCDYQINIFTKRLWNFDKSLYPDVNFIEVDSKDLFEWHNYWWNEIPEFIKTRADDIFLLSEQDIFFTKQLKPSIEEAYQKQMIIINDETYHVNIRDTFDKEVYPRLWEGGLILPRVHLIEPLTKHKITLGAGVKSKYVLDLLKQCDANLTMLNWRIRDITRTTNLDTLAELTLYSYISEVPVKKEKLAVHFARTETLHRAFPYSYGPEISEVEIIMFRREMYYKLVLQLYYISGVISWNKTLEKEFIFQNNEDAKVLTRLMRNCDEWMTREETSRIKHLIGLRRGFSQIKML